jgi:hypothetical protein
MLRVKAERLSPGDVITLFQIARGKTKYEVTEILPKNECQNTVVVGFYNGRFQILAADDDGYVTIEIQ